MYILYKYICCRFNIQKTELMENGNFSLFAANRKGKRKFVFLGQQTDERLLTITVSTSVPIYVIYIHAVSKRVHTYIRIPKLPRINRMFLHFYICITASVLYAKCRAGQLTTFPGEINPTVMHQAC
jgi:hypothetical protein